MVDSKAKGSAFESKIKDIFTKHFKIKFERVPLSGSLTWCKGDIFSPTNPDFPYCIECKHYAELDFNSLLTAKSNDIYSFWEQSVEAAKKMNKKPIVIFRWNRSKDFIIWDDNTICNPSIQVEAFNKKFKISLLSDWLLAVKI